MLPSHLHLKGKTVDLLTLQPSHFSELISLSRDEHIWEFFPVDGKNPKRFEATLQEALEEKEQGREYPFVVFHKAEQKIIGATRYLNIVPHHRKLEIGWTWLHPGYWKSSCNAESKFLLLEYAFEKLKTVRVQLKTDETNIRSRKAIEKIGAKYEGTLRNEMIKDNGKTRNSAYYSIIDAEWPAVREKLALSAQMDLNFDKPDYRK